MLIKHKKDPTTIMEVQQVMLIPMKKMKTPPIRYNQP